MTPDQLSEIEWYIKLAGSMIIGVQIVMGLVVLQVCRRIARNEVELADLLRQAVSQIESDLPKK